MVNDKPVDLTDRVCQLLEYFVANQRRVVTKDAITEHIWGDEYLHVGNYDFIYTHIKNLRKKLIDAGCGDYVETAYAAGESYRPLILILHVT